MMDPSNTGPLTTPKEKPKASLPLMQNVNQQNDPMLDVSHPASQLQWSPASSPAVIGGSPMGSPLPSYAQGGDVPKDQVAQVDQGERVLNPEEAHAYKAAAQGEAPPTLAGRIASRFHEIYNKGKAGAENLVNQGHALAQPLDNEAKAWQEKQRMVNEAANPTDPPPARMQPYSSAPMDPNSQYGQRSGEHRLDPQGNVINPTTPQGMGATGPQMPVPAAMNRLPSYDTGGDVDTDQTAKLGAGEHVLDPDKAAAYRQAEAEVTQEHGAPADFGGQVIPNPKGLKVQGDTEASAPERMTGGARMNTDNAPLTKPKMDASNPPMNQMETPMQEASTRLSSQEPSKMKPLPGIEAPMGSGATDHPMSEEERNAASMKNAGQTVQHGPPVDPEKLALVKADQEKAMQAGPAGLADLGTSLIHERVLRGPAKDTLPQVQPTAPSPEEGLKNEKDELHQKMLYAPTEQERFQAEKDLAELKRKTPWGSAENHPGFLGKLAHGASSVAQGLAQGVAPYVLPSIPGSQANIQKQENIGEQGVEQAQKEQTAAAEIKLKEAQTRAAGAKTPSEQVYMHATRGGPDGGPQINPDTQKPYTDAEALQLATGAGKAPLQQAMNDLQKQINPDTGKKYSPEEAFAKASFDASNARMNEHQKRVADYVHAHNMEDTPANRETARVALETADTNAKALATLPYAEQKTKFSSDLATTRALLVQQNADANTRGLKADELQNTENARYDKVTNQIQLAKDALADSDTSQFAANIVPVITTLTTTSAEGVKRINKQELDKFMPADGSLGRWVEAHADKWMAGEIPPEYKTEVGSFLDKLGKSFNVEHTTNTKSIDDTVRQGGQQPTQKPEGGTGTPKPSKTQTPPTTPPTGSTHTGVSSVDGKTYYLDANGKKMGEATK